MFRRKSDSVMPKEATGLEKEIVKNGKKVSGFHRSRCTTVSGSVSSM